MASTAPTDRPSREQRDTHLPKEEPDFVDEPDLPSADEPARDKPARDGGPPKNADVAGVDSTAGEEDPGAALDTPPTPSPTRRPA